jgi:hypothetical protein
MPVLIGDLRLCCGTHACACLDVAEPAHAAITIAALCDRHVSALIVNKE